MQTRNPAGLPGAEAGARSRGPAADLPPWPFLSTQPVAALTGCRTAGARSSYDVAAVVWPEVGVALSPVDDLRSCRRAEGQIQRSWVLAHAPFRQGLPDCGLGDAPTAPVGCGDRRGGAISRERPVDPMGVSGPVAHLRAASGYCGRLAKGKARATAPKSSIAPRSCRVPATRRKSLVLAGRSRLHARKFALSMRCLDSIASPYEVPRKPCGVAERRSLHEASNRMSSLTFIGLGSLLNTGMRTYMIGRRLDGNSSWSCRPEFTPIT
jgi:hypothetical protein